MRFWVSPPEKLGFWHPATLSATWFGVGLLRPAPGTWGSLAALPVGLILILVLTPVGLALIAALFFAIGVWASNAMEAASQTKDPSSVVLDEVVGQWVVLLFTPLTLGWYAAAFLLFRLFDIWKPWPVRWADRELKGGLGVMSDDVLAAIYAALTITILFRVL
jgi:phosphatidylglycerophosphatase A